MELDKVKLGHSPLTDTIFLYRHGKDPALALEKREAEHDVMAVLVAHMMHDAPKGSEKVITLGGKQYTIRVTPNVGRSQISQIGEWYERIDEIKARTEKESWTTCDQFAIREDTPYLLQQLAEREKDAARYRLCVEHGFPRFVLGRNPRASFADPGKIIGEHTPCYWVMTVGEKSYIGATETEAIDAALLELPR